jgi:hypothetical protein
MDEQ